MRLRKFSILVLLPIVTTIIGGIIILVVERIAPPKVPSENLVYLVLDPTTYYSQKYSTSSAFIKNNGDLSAKDVKVVISFNNESIQDFQIISSSFDSSKDLGLYEVEDFSSNELVIHIPNIVPDETFSFSMILDGSFIRKPTLDARSNSSTARSTESLLINPLLVAQIEYEKCKAQKNLWIIATIVLGTILGILIFRSYFFQNYRSDEPVDTQTKQKEREEDKMKEEN